MDKNNETSTVIAVPLERISVRRHRLPNARMVQNFLLIWLDTNIDENNSDDCRNTITKLRQVVNAVNTFVDVDECIDFITEIKEEKAFMIVSGALGQTTVPLAHNMPQLTAIYILCGNRARHEQWAKHWPKVKGVYTDIIPICEALKQAAQDCDHNSVSIGFVKMTDGTSKQNLDTLDQSFMYTQILKEILLTIDFEQKHINEFLTYCQEQFAGNSFELKNVEKLRKEYRDHQAIWWYTNNCFLYSMLNRALRLMEVDLIIKMGFFVRDLHNQIAELHAEQYARQHGSDSFTVYRGQVLSEIGFDQLMKTQGGLMSFNNFLSTSLDREISLAFVESKQNNTDLIGVLFEITINPLIFTSPFAKVGHVSFYRGEEELLFSMHSVFRIGQIKQIDRNDRIWQVDLILTGDNDPQLHALTESMREETFPYQKGWYRLANLLIKLGEFDKAQRMCGIMLDQSSEEVEKANIYYMLGMIKHGQGNYREAITFHEKALELKQKNLPPNHPSLATSYNNIGAVYENMGEYSKALSSYEKALEIRQQSLPSNHPSLATSYNNIGLVYENIGEYSKALSYYEKALEIYQKTLPSNHPDLATSYNNIGGVYNSMGEYQRALSYLERALEIKQKSLPSNHPNLAVSYNNIGLLYHKMGEYSKALSFLEKAVEIYQKTLPSNHPNLAISFNNIGLVYDNMGEYSKALSSHEKALEIRQQSLPSNHPDLAISCNNIGLVYDKLDDCSKAFFYHEKALEIYQETLPPYHPSLATSYNNIGEVYFKMKDYSKALSSYEHALHIQLRSLPSNHPDTGTVRENIEKVKTQL
jgi:tetratricopeptide (TPR) repeat protein